MIEANKNLHRPILVSGAHRTGTTWVGKMLTAGGQTAYISEPFNVWHRRGVFRSPISQWYTYVCQKNEADYLASMRETVHYNYHTDLEIQDLRSIKDFLRMARDLGIFWRGKFLRLRPLLKDPFSVFSLPWFIEQLQCQVVITVRHPAAFVSSLKRLDWNFDFRDLLQQPLLMHDWLGSYQQDMENLLKTPDDVIGQGSLLWRMVYQVVDACQKRYPDIHIVRHEDFSLESLERFRSLYATLGLEFNASAQKAVLNSSNAENPGEVSREHVHSTKLDSQSNLQNWKRRLSADEISRIRQLTHEIATRYYPQDEWE